MHGESRSLSFSLVPRVSLSVRLVTPTRFAPAAFSLSHVSLASLPLPRCDARVDCVLCSSCTILCPARSEFAGSSYSYNNNKERGQPRRRD